MALPNVKINLQDGALGRTSQTTDGVAGLIIAADGSKDLKMNKVYQLASPKDLLKKVAKLDEIELVYKEVSQFYAKAGEGAELYLLLVGAGADLMTMVTVQDTTKTTPLEQLIGYARGRIRLVGLSALPKNQPGKDGLDEDVAEAVDKAHQIANNSAAKINPFRVFIPANGWNGKTGDDFFTPSTCTYDRVAVVMASDAIIEEKQSAAIGQVLGTAAGIPVNYSIARVKNGIAASKGWLMDGRKPEENESVLDTLHMAGYIIYRYFVGRSGYYFNDDPMAASPSQTDYSSLNLGRVIDKAIMIAYDTFISEINDSIEIDEEGNIPKAVCKYYEGMISNAVMSLMQYEISSFESFVDPEQNVLSTSTMTVNCKIVPKGILRTIEVQLGFENPALNNNQEEETEE